MRAQSVILAVLLGCGGCRPQMGDQPRYQAYESSDFFADGSAMRPIPEHTVARDQGPRDAFHTGMKDGKLTGTLPVPLTAELLSRGQDRFNIHCAVCHGLSGSGDGLVVQRGFPAPNSYHTARLRSVPIGYFFHVMTDGYGAMYSYASRVPPRDRWAIAAYIKALQLSENASVEDLPAGERERLEALPPSP